MEYNLQRQREQRQRERENEDARKIFKVKKEEQWCELIKSQILLALHTNTIDHKVDALFEVLEILNITVLGEIDIKINEELISLEGEYFGDTGGTT